jgi:hypothetical protein
MFIAPVRRVRASIAVVVNLLSFNSTDHRFNNLRGAFLAGLAIGADKEALILQEGEEPVPVDYRDLVRVYRHPDDIDPLIAELVPKVTERLQEVTFELSSSLQNLLERINLGAPLRRTKPLSWAPIMSQRTSIIKPCQE